MKKIYISIFELNLREIKQGFDINLEKTSFLELAGNWSCLPGYLPKVKGHFSYLTGLGGEVRRLIFADRDMTFKEVLYGTGRDSNICHYMTLDDFPHKPKIGNKGKGLITDFGIYSRTMFDNDRLFNNLEWIVMDVI